MVSAAEILQAAGYSPAAYDEYGRCTTGGFRADRSNRPGVARIEHVVPTAWTLVGDPERRSGDEVFVAKQAARDAYARALDEAGWPVEMRTTGSGTPILLTSPHTEKDGDR